MVWNRNQPLLKVVGRIILFTLVMMRLWPLQLLMTVASWKKWKLLHGQIWTTMPWTGISLVVASTELVILHRLREISLQRLIILQPSQRPFIWRMTFTIPPEIHGNATSQLLTMPPIWTVQMVWVRFGLLRGVSLIVRQVWLQQALFKWRV